MYQFQHEATGESFLLRVSQNESREGREGEEEWARDRPENGMLASNRGRRAIEDECFR